MKELARKALAAPQFRLAVKIVGLCIMAICLVYVGRAVVASLAVVEDALTRWQAWAGLAAGTAIYSASLYAIYTAWISILNDYPGRDVPPASGMYLSAMTHLLKYLPSNVVQHGWRVVELKRGGVDLKRIAGSSIVELAVMLVSASLAYLVAEAFVRSVALGASAAAIAAAALAAGLYAMRCAREPISRIPVLGRFVDEFASVRELTLLRAIMWYLVYFVTNGAAIAVVAWCVFPGSSWNLPVFVAVFAGAFAAGFLTPGAPAGLGVREAVYVYLLPMATALNPAEAAVLALVARACSVLGDVLFSGPMTVLTGRRHAAWRNDKTGSRGDLEF